MMSPDRAPPPRLEASTTDALRAILGEAVRKGNHTDELRDTLCTVAAEARQKGIQAEQLLVILKDLWYSLPELSRASNPGAHTALLRELISRCIQEYYGE
jgi:hypothetical protein